MAKSKLIAIPVNEEERDLFRKLAERERRTMADAVRQLVRQSVEQHPSPQERAA